MRWDHWQWLENHIQEVNAAFEIELSLDTPEARNNAEERNDKKETKNKRIFIGSPRMMETEQFSELIAELDHAAFSEDPNIREVVKRLVPEYTYKQTNQQTK